ncbi:MAG TPA: metallophosphoesterase [Verrucomicrobiae bacterium]|jgi:3',5'-cyclic AMP phosphodiesterase CpdA|nr:metallophosphoesterase [Verrucomicrobiae bacterium]
MKRVDRRSFLKISGSSLGIGVLYSACPAALSAGETGSMFAALGRANGERVSPFSFVQLSDAHVGFNGPPDPLGTKAFERAVEMINGLPQRPDLIVFTGDLTHDTEDKDVHAQRMKQFQEISKKINVPLIKCVAGEHDAGLDSGALYREFFGESYYSFDHRGVHFVALDNVSRAKPEVGVEQLTWLKKDLARFERTAPIVVFTHRPLFDLRPDWEWFTSDGDEVMNVLSAYDNVTVLYGHIHRDDEHQLSNVHHYAARSLIFAFPDPQGVSGPRRPVPFDKDHPFKNLGIRTVTVNGKSRPGSKTLSIEDIELTAREFRGINGIQQLLREPQV